MAIIKGTGAVSASDYKAVKWVGETKSGKAVTIALTKAINMGNIEFTLAEKDEVVPTITFTSVYSNTDAQSDSTAEPWTIEVEDGLTAGAGEILLGLGVFYVGNTAVALTRGGGSFKVEREFRPITADGDRGPVEGRVAMDASTATLELNALTMLKNMADLYAGVEEAVG